MLTETIEINLIRSLSLGWKINQKPNIVEKTRTEIEKQSNIIGLLGESYKGKS